MKPWLIRIFDGSQMGAGAGAALTSDVLGVMKLELVLSELSDHRITKMGVKILPTNKRQKHNLQYLVKF